MRAVSIQHRWYQVWVQYRPIPTQCHWKMIRVPLNYRGVSLLSTIYKFYLYLLNKRLMEFVKKEQFLVVEQNGFRRSRACIGHIYTVTTIIRNTGRLKENKTTFEWYIDFQTAFDFINRHLLSYLLIKTGKDGVLSGNMLPLHCSPSLSQNKWHPDKLFFHPIWFKAGWRPFTHIICFLQKQSSYQNQIPGLWGEMWKWTGPYPLVRADYIILIL